MSKLSATQQHVVDRMKEGWQVVADYGVGGSIVITLRLQGFSPERVREATFSRLWDLGIVRRVSNNSRGTTIYRLTKEA